MTIIWHVPKSFLLWAHDNDIPHPNPNSFLSQARTFTIIWYLLPDISLWCFEGTTRWQQKNKICNEYVEDAIEKGGPKTNAIYNILKWIRQSPTESRPGDVWKRETWGEAWLVEIGEGELSCSSSKLQALASPILFLTLSSLKLRWDQLHFMRISMLPALPAKKDADYDCETNRLDPTDTSPRSLGSTPYKNSSLATVWLSQHLESNGLDTTDTSPRSFGSTPRNLDRCLLILQARRHASC